MTRPDRIESIEDIILWITDHDARIDVFWKNQHNWNKGVDLRFEGSEKRVTILEKKVIFVAGIAAAIGSGLGAFLIQFLTSGGST